VLDPASSPVMPQAIGVLFLFGAVVTVAGSVLSRCGPLRAALALALVAVPEFVRQGTSQLADVPVGAFTVLAVALVATPQPGAVRVGMSGAALGLAAWTKNEGLVVALVFPLTYLGLHARREGLAAAFQRGVDMVVGLGPVLVVVVLFKILVAPVNDLMDGIRRPGVLNYWQDHVRVGFVARYMATRALAWGGWWSAVGPSIAVLGVAALRRPPRESGDIAVTASGALLLFQLGTFFAVYVMTPHSVAWHLETSWSRLIAQMWPTFVWWACAGGSTGVRGQSAAT